MINNLIKEFDLTADSKKAENLSRFFKTGRGQYGEGDMFLGIMVPTQRMLAKKYFKDLSMRDISFLLKNKIHEYRLTALFMLILKFNKADELDQKKIFNFYLKNTKKINNWDLVDLSAPNIIGKYLVNKDQTIIYRLSQSKNLWEKRISVLATFPFIKLGVFKPTLKIAETLIDDKHDLIQKAVGWMLRELGKRNLKIEEDFLKKHYKTMPRTALRYAIEKFPESKRQFYLKK